MTQSEINTQLEINRLEKVEKYIRSLKWSKEAIDYEKTLVAGNIRAYANYLYNNPDEIPIDPPFIISKTIKLTERQKEGLKTNLKPGMF